MHFPAQSTPAVLQHALSHESCMAGDRSRPLLLSELSHPLTFPGKHKVPAAAVYYLSWQCLLSLKYFPSKGNLCEAAEHKGWLSA